MSATSGAIAWQALEEISRDVSRYLSSLPPSSSSSAAAAAGITSALAALPAPSASSSSDSQQQQHEVASLRKEVARLQQALKQPQQQQEPGVSTASSSSSSSSRHPSRPNAHKRSRLSLSLSHATEEEEEEEEASSLGFEGALVLKRLERQLEEERLLRTADGERAALRVEAAEGECERLRRQLKFLTEEEERARTELREATQRNAQERQRLQERIHAQGRRLDELEGEAQAAKDAAGRLRRELLAASSSSSGGGGGGTAAPAVAELQAALRAAGEEVKAKRALEVEVASLRRRLEEEAARRQTLEGQEAARPDNEGLVRRLVGERAEQARALKRAAGERESLLAERDNAALLKEQILELEASKRRLEQRVASLVEAEAAKAAQAGEEGALARQLGAWLGKEEKGADTAAVGGAAAAATIDASPSLLLTRVTRLVRRLREESTLVWSRLGESERAKAAVTQELAEAKAQQATDRSALSSLRDQLTVLEERLAGAEPVAAALRRENATLKRLLDAYESKRFGTTAPQQAAGQQQGEEGAGASEKSVEALRLQELEAQLTAAHAALAAMEQRVDGLASPQLMKGAQGKAQHLEAEAARAKDEAAYLQTQLQQRETALKAAEQALARLESRMARGVGDYDPATTKVLHVRDNPTVLFLRAEILALKQENDSLKKQAQAAANHSISASLGDSSMAVSAAAEGGTAIAPGETVDSARYHQRLKEAFRQRIVTYRDAVYQLTGYMVALSTDREHPRVTLRSMFAESQEDCLLFQWRGETLEMLQTDFARERLNPALLDLLRRTNSLPLFLAAVTQDLFEKSTLSLPAL